MYNNNLKQNSYLKPQKNWRPAQPPPKLPDNRNGCFRTGYLDQLNEGYRGVQYNNGFENDAQEE